MANFAILLGLFIYIYALLGMQFFANRLKVNCGVLFLLFVLRVFPPLLWPTLPRHVPHAIPTRWWLYLPSRYHSQLFLV